MFISCKEYKIGIKKIVDLLPLDKKLEHMQEIGRIVGRYLFPVLLILIGLFLLFSSGGQTIWYKMGSAGILIVGILGFLFVKGIISLKAQIIVAVVIGVGALFIGFKDYDVIQDRLAYDQLKKKIEAQVIQRLKDIRKAELAYQKENGVYTPSFDTLIDFLKNGEVRLIKRLGSLPDTVPTEEMARELGLIHHMPDTLTEDEVIALGIIVRDTIMVPVGSYVFDEDDTKSRKFPLYIDSLPYVPFGKHKFELATGTIQSGGVTQPVFQVLDPQPFADQFIVGSLERANTAGNWKE